MYAKERSNTQFSQVMRLNFGDSGEGEHSFWREGERRFQVEDEQPSERSDAGILSVT